MTLDSLMSIYKENDCLCIHMLRSSAYSLPKNVARKIHCEALSLVYGRTSKHPKNILRIICDILDRKLYPADTEEQNCDKRFLSILFHNKGMDLINHEFCTIKLY